MANIWLYIHIYNPHVRNVSLVHTLHGIAAGITIFSTTLC